MLYITICSYYQPYQFIKQVMDIKVILLSLLLLAKCVSLNGHQLLSSHGLAHGHEQMFGFHAIPRKLMLNQKVEGAADQDLVSYNENISGESHKGGEEAAASSSKVKMQEKSHHNRVFTMDYGHVRKRRPVHNKSFPTTAVSP